MLLGLYQSKSPAGDISAGFDILGDALAKAADAGVDMLTLPELFVPGYEATVNGAEFSDFCDSFAQMAAKFCVSFAIGVPERDGNRVYNTAFCFGSDGSIPAITPRTAAQSSTVRHMGPM